MKVTGVVALATLGVASAAFSSGNNQFTIQHNGVTRRANVYAPVGYDANRPTPMVFNIHGLTSNGNQQAPFTGMNPVADANNFLVLYPEGEGTPQSWNAGACCAPSSLPINGVDDVGFFRALVDYVASETSLDKSRVYSTGMSNGAFMSHRLGCEASDMIAAIAPVAGVLANTGGGGSDKFDCIPRRPVPVFHVHGTEDLLVPYNGNRLLGFPSVADSIDGWSQRNAVAGAESNTTYRGTGAAGSTECLTKGAGSNEVTLCTFTGGHVWGSAYGMDVSARMWEFFSQKSL